MAEVAEDPEVASVITKQICLIVFDITKVGSCRFLQFINEEWCPFDYIRGGIIFRLKTLMILILLTVELSL